MEKKSDRRLRRLAREEDALQGRRLSCSSSASSEVDGLGAVNLVALARRCSVFTTRGRGSLVRQAGVESDESSELGGPVVALAFLKGARACGMTRAWHFLLQCGAGSLALDSCLLKLVALEGPNGCFPQFHGQDDPFVEKKEHAECFHELAAMDYTLEDWHLKPNISKINQCVLPEEEEPYKEVPLSCRKVMEKDQNACSGMGKLIIFDRGLKKVRNVGYALYAFTRERDGQVKNVVQSQIMLDKSLSTSASFLPCFLMLKGSKSMTRPFGSP